MADPTDSVDCLPKNSVGHASAAVEAVAVAVAAVAGVAGVAVVDSGRRGTGWGMVPVGYSLVEVVADHRRREVNGDHCS